MVCRTIFDLRRGSVLNGAFGFGSAISVVCSPAAVVEGNCINLGVDIVDKSKSPEAKSVLAMGCSLPEFDDWMPP